MPASFDVRRCWIAGTTLLILLGVAQTGSSEESWTSKDEMYVLSYTSELQPIVINRIHRWTLHLTASDGTPVTDAKISVVGGMPEHNHGLPTSPQITSDLGNGNYLLEGMRFHMNGYWELTVSIDADSGSDTVVVRMTLQDVS